VRERARAMGHPASSDHELLDALFAPEFSTAAAGQELSGRGMGLTAIRATARALGGDAVMESARGKGSELRITLPRQLAVA
jgi:two-component system, chemotaxis family, sensor kinase CheA